MEATISTKPNSSTDLANFSREAVTALSRSRQEPNWVLEQRLAAFDTFESLPMPSRSDEEWRRLRLGFGHLLGGEMFDMWGALVKHHPKFNAQGFGN